MSTSAVVDRVPLDPWDELFHGLYNRAGGSGTGAAVLHLRGVIDRDALRTALAALQQRHPKLRARIIESSDGRHAFAFDEDPPPIPLELKDIPGAMHWQEETNRVLGLKLDPARDPLARVVVLRAPDGDRCVLILLVHHVVADGRSTVQLLHDLLRYYADAEQNNTVVVQPVSIATATQARASAPLWKRALLAAALLRNRHRNRKAEWTRLPEAAGEAPSFLWTHLVFTEQETAALAVRCRREKAAVYGALFAAGARGLRAALGQQHATFRCRFPVDVRALLTSESGPLTDDHIGNFFSGCEVFCDVDDRSAFWILARKARRDMERFKAAGGPSVVYNLIRFLKLPYVPPTIRRGTLVVNSYGMANLQEQYGSLAAEELSIVFNHVPAGPSLLMQGLVVRKRLSLDVSMVDVPRDFWEKVIDEIRKELKEAIYGERHDQRAIRA